MTQPPEQERPGSSDPGETENTRPLPPAVWETPAQPVTPPHGDPLPATPPLTPPPQSWPQPGYGVPAAPYGQPAYGVPAAPYGQPGYGVHPRTGQPYSDKSKVAAGLLQVLLPFLGICGVGRLYTGHLGIGLTQLLLMFLGFILMLLIIGFLIVPAIWLWTVIDGIVILSTDSTDAQGRMLRS